MGIRYYAYAFREELTEKALADPRAFIASDPLADAWGMEPHASVSIPTFEQTSPPADMLYLDKAWSELQSLTAPPDRFTLPRPAYRMFEGQVTHHDLGWDAWVRALTPDQVEAVAEDLDDIADEEAETFFRELNHFGDDDVRREPYALGYLRRARAWIADLADGRRGMAYLIG